jgi:cell division protease FtsH
VEPAAVPTTRFSDVAGCDEAIADLTEMVLFLREPERFTRTGAKAPKGALLVGPPGTGKTLLARAVAGEAGVPFFTAAGSDFTEMYVGVGAKRVRELFAAARKHPRAILFIDEIDTVARRRSADGDQGAGETENTLVALLAEMDGFDDSNVIVLAATNRDDILDPALTRPGRLDRKVEVPNPDRRGRERILAVHTTGKPVGTDLDLTALARRTPGFSGAQLAALVNEACMEAARRDLATVSHECFDHAVATVAMGRARTSALVTDHDREVTAWHEAGHTLAAFLQSDADDPVQVTIVPRGPAGGVTWMSGNDDLFLPRRKAHAQLVTALAGRAAEEVLLDGEYTQGAAGDLQSATDLAFRMATQYGMTRLGYQVRHPRSAAGTDAVSDVVEELLAEAHVAATALLAGHREFLGAVAAALLDEETLTLAQVAVLAERCGVTGPATVAVPPPPRRAVAEAPAENPAA